MLSWHWNRERQATVTYQIMDPICRGIPGTVPQSLVQDAKCHMFFHVIKYDVHENTYRHFDLPPVGKNMRGRQWRTEGGFGVFNPPPKFRRPSKIVPKLNPICENLKIAEFRTPTPQDVRKKGSKILKLPRFATVLH